MVIPSRCNFLLCEVNEVRYRITEITFPCGTQKFTAEKLTLSGYKLLKAGEWHLTFELAEKQLKQYRQKKFKRRYYL